MVELEWIPRKFVLRCENLKGMAFHQLYELSLHASTFKMKPSHSSPLSSELDAPRLRYFA